MDRLEDRTLLLLVAVVSLLFAWILWPYSGAILWAVVLATMFARPYRRVLQAMPRWPNTAALLTLLIIVVLVILPLTLVASLLVQEAAEVYAAFKSGDLDLTGKLQQARTALPGWAAGLFDRVQAGDLDELRDRLSSVLMQSGGFLAGKAITVGQGTINFVVAFFVMLYLLFFLLRDGEALRRRIGRAVPLRAEHKAELVAQFAVTIRATVKGTLVVAVVQGALGGLMFWYLGIRAPLVWGASMAVLSLLPVVGSAIVWVPVAIYLAVTGEVWQGVLLVAYGVLVIGLVDNLLRPVLVGKDTRIPDYVILIATLGGLSVFGVNGLIIGPILAAMFLAVWHVFSERRRGEAAA
jgi:predicted PurR-regulated permease PerM